MDLFRSKEEVLSFRYVCHHLGFLTSKLADLLASPAGRGTGAADLLTRGAAGKGSANLFLPYLGRFGRGAGAADLLTMGTSTSFGKGEADLLTMGKSTLGKGAADLLGE